MDEPDQVLGYSGLKSVDLKFTAQIIIQYHKTVQPSPGWPKF